MPFTIPLTSTTQAFAAPPAGAEFDFGGTGYAVAFFYVMNAAVNLSLKTGAVQGSSNWGPEFPVPPSSLTLSAGGATGHRPYGSELIFGVRARTLATGLPWSAATSYAIGDVVTQAGVTYSALVANVNTQPPNAVAWQVVDATVFGSAFQPGEASISSSNATSSSISSSGTTNPCPCGSGTGGGGTSVETTDGIVDVNPTAILDIGTGLVLTQPVLGTAHIANSGVLSVAKSGSAAITGAATFSAVAPVVLTEVGQNLAISLSGAGIPGFTTVRVLAPADAAAGYTPSTGAVVIDVYATGAGGGGGGGAARLNTEISVGGSAGGAGSTGWRRFRVADLPASPVPLTIPAGATGGAGGVGTAGPNNGTGGSDGATTIFSSGSTLVQGFGGGGGTGGTQISNSGGAGASYRQGANVATGGAPATGVVAAVGGQGTNGVSGSAGLFAEWGGAGGGAGGPSGNPGLAGAGATFGGSGGGGGGGRTNGGGSSSAGGAGGIPGGVVTAGGGPAAGAANGGAGNNGAADPIVGTGGSGGGAANQNGGGTGGRGGDGGPGSGGGGGGANGGTAVAPHGNGGRGGDGGPGVMMIVEWF